MGGYQQLVRGDVMRGKFRNSFEKPEPFTPGKPTAVKFTLPDVYHTFRTGHRIMVQVQSSWFPLVDRNPQTFMDIYTREGSRLPQGDAARLPHPRAAVTRDAAGAAMTRFIILVSSVLVWTPVVQAGERALDDRLHHLRQGEQREWSDFPVQAEGPSLDIRFRAEANAAEQTLRLRQQDVQADLEGPPQRQGTRPAAPDENDMVIYLPLPPAALATGENTLRIEQVGKVAR